MVRIDRERKERREREREGKWKQEKYSFLKQHLTVASLWERQAKTTFPIQMQYCGLPLFCVKSAGAAEAWGAGLDS